MSIQTKACFKKEILAYFRSRKFLIIACVIVGIALLSPLMIVLFSTLMDAMSDMYAQFDTDVSGLTESITEYSSTGMASSVSDITSAGLIVMLILLSRAAGGEQKKRAVIIPRSAGLRSFSYLFPKYIIYPLSAFFLSIIAMLASWFVSGLIFNSNDVTFANAFLASTLVGTTMMFYVCLHLTLGTATGQAGMSAVVCIVMSMILPLVFASVDMDYMFNPFALNMIAASVLHSYVVPGSQIVDILISIAFALGIMVTAFFIALFAQNARRIDNTGEEIEL